MSKYVAVIPLDKIARIAILPGQGRSLTQVKGEADYIINGGFYDMGTGKPTGHLKADGQVLAGEAWNCWGFRWDTGADIRMDVIPDSGGKNYISGVELLGPSLKWGGKLSYPKEVGGKRGRTALALTGDSLILYCSGDGTKDTRTPEQLQEELAGMGAGSALMLDGGGSSQCSFPTGKISSSRRVHNYIAVWMKKNNGTGTPDKAEGFGGEKTNSEMSEPLLSGGGERYGGCEDEIKKVVLDPGHGVETAGKCAPDKSYYEHEFNLDMAKRVKAQLERHGVITLLTRSGEKDVSLADRVRLSNEAKPDLFVSLHSNASGDGENWTAPSGYGVYTSAAGSAAGRNKAAKAILTQAKAAGIPLWGEGLYHDLSLYVLKNTAAPAVLIEHGFHTNINEVELLKNDAYRDLLARVDARGVLDYLGIPWIEDPNGFAGKGEDLTGGKSDSEKSGSAICPHCGGRLKISKGE